MYLSTCKKVLCISFLSIFIFSDISRNLQDGSLCFLSLHIFFLRCRWQDGRYHLTEMLLLYLPWKYHLFAVLHRVQPWYIWIILYIFSMNRQILFPNLFSSFQLTLTSYHALHKRLFVSKAPWVDESINRVGVTITITITITICWCRASVYQNPYYYRSARTLGTLK